MKNDSASFLKYLGSMVLGVFLTLAYVRFSYSMPTIVQIPAKITDTVTSSAAEYDLYSDAASDETRHRALAVILAHDPDLFIELDGSVGKPILSEVLRRKAVRRAQLLYQQLHAYDAALKKPALRSALQRKHGAAESDRVLKRRMLSAAIADESFLSYYFDRVYPDADREQRCELVETIYEHHFQEPPSLARIPAECQERSPAKMR